MTVQRLLHAVLLSLVASCTGEPWVVAAVLVDAATDAGDAGPDAAVACPSAESMRGAGLATLPSPSLDAAHVGTWRGRVEGLSSAAFPGGRVELRLDVDGSGVLQFRDIGLPPPPADSTAGYACEDGDSGVLCGSVSGFVGGYPYTLFGLRSRGAVVSFTVLEGQPWNTFCQLASPVAWSDANATCGFSHGLLPPGSSSWSAQGCTHSSGGTTTDVDCAWLYSARRCECAFDGCFAGLDARVDLGLELVDSGTVLQGSLWSFDGTRAVTLRLSRVGS